MSAGLAEASFSPVAVRALRSSRLSLDGLGSVLTSFLCLEAADTEYTMRAKGRGTDLKALWPRRRGQEQELGGLSMEAAP